jgi:hypothetical protein
MIYIINIKSTNHFNPEPIAMKKIANHTPELPCPATAKAAPMGPRTTQAFSFKGGVTMNEREQIRMLGMAAILETLEKEARALYDLLKPKEKEIYPLEDKPAEMLEDEQAKMMAARVCLNGMAQELGSLSVDASKYGQKAQPEETE